MQTSTQKSALFSAPALENLVGFSATLQRIHNRLIAEGYRIVDGKMIPPEVKKDYNSNTEPNGHSRAI